MTTRIKTFTRKRIYRSPYSHVQDSENYDNVQTDDKWVYRGFSNGITILNLLMTTLTLTIVYLHRSPLAPLMNTDIQCKCPQQSIDLRYKNPSMNPDIKRVSGYCMYHRQYPFQMLSLFCSSFVRRSRPYPTAESAQRGLPWQHHNLHARSISRGW